MEIIKIFKSSINNKHRCFKNHERATKNDSTCKNESKRKKNSTLEFG